MEMPGATHWDVGTDLHLGRNITLVYTAPITTSFRLIPWAFTNVEFMVYVLGGEATVVHLASKYQQLHRISNTR